MISATPFASVTTRATENELVASIEIADTSFSEIVEVSETCEVAHPVNKSAAANRPIFFTTLVCQSFMRHVVVSCRISMVSNRFRVLL